MPEATGIPFPHVSSNVYQGLRTEDGSQNFIIQCPYSGEMVKKISVSRIVSFIGNFLIASITLKPEIEAEKERKGRSCKMEVR